MLRSAGADEFVDHRASPVPPPGRRFDVVVDMVAGSACTEFVAALNPGGVYLIVNPRLSDMLGAVWTSRFADRWAVFELAAESREELTTLKGMLEAGEIRPVVDGVLPIERNVEAHERVETERRRGAVVVTIGSQALLDRRQPIRTPGRGDARADAAQPDRLCSRSSSVLSHASEVSTILSRSS